MKTNAPDQSQGNVTTQETQSTSAGAPQISRRQLLTTAAKGLGAAALLSAGLPKGWIGGAYADDVIRTGKSAEAADFEPIWDSAKVLIGNGNSSADQEPSLFIECPLFFSNGRFANAFHTLDLSDEVTGSITVRNNTVHPDFSGSFPAEVTHGSDGNDYLLGGGEGKLTDGRGYFRNVDTVIIRCKYKVKLDTNGNLESLISCVHCVIISVQS